MLADLAAQARIVHVIGTTGFDAKGEARLKAAARRAVIVKSGNMSMGVNLLAALAETRRQGAGRLRHRDRWKCITATRWMRHPGPLALLGAPPRARARDRACQTCREKPPTAIPARARTAISVSPPCAAALWWASIR